MQGIRASVSQNAVIGSPPPFAQMERGGWRLGGELVLLPTLGNDEVEPVTPYVSGTGLESQHANTQDF